MQSWLCPSDRQLRLRACIARGWSTPRAAVATLTSTECAAISDVLRRDRALRMLDWGRVGRVADQVERLRLAQCGDGSASCRLCGRQLRHRWWRSAGLCVDCGFRFCDHCASHLPDIGKSKDEAQSSAAWLCKLCRESRLLAAKSGAWFHHQEFDSHHPPEDCARSPNGESPSSSTNQESPVSPDAVTSSRQSFKRSQSQKTINVSSGAVDLRGARKCQSHYDLQTYFRPNDSMQRSNDTGGGALGPRRNGKLSRARNMAVMRRRKSASCSQLGQVQCEYFPTELIDE